MTPHLDLMVFTDLDGTLIDHHTYSWAAAAPALDRLRAIGAGVVLASSKTAVEIAPLRRELGLSGWPAIVENGAGCLPAASEPEAGGAQYTELRACLDRISQDLRRCFKGFGDMSVTEVAHATGLPEAASVRAKSRAFSEPGLWTGTNAQRAAFESELASAGVSAQQGGRFLTLSFGGNKAEQMRQLIEAHHPRHTVALGDAPNDIAMLEAADFGIIVCNPDGQPLPPLKGEPEGKIKRTIEAGPSGWNKAILTLLDKLELN